MMSEDNQIYCTVPDNVRTSRWWKNIIVEIFFYCDILLSFSVRELKLIVVEITCPYHMPMVRTYKIQYRRILILGLFFSFFFSISQFPVVENCLWKTRIPYF